MKSRSTAGVNVMVAGADCACPASGCGAGSIATRTVRGLAARQILRAGGADEICPFFNARRTNQLAERNLKSHEHCPPPPLKGKRRRLTPERGRQLVTDFAQAMMGSIFDVPWTSASRWASHVQRARSRRWSVIWVSVAAGGLCAPPLCGSSTGVQSSRCEPHNDLTLADLDA